MSMHHQLHHFRIIVLGLLIYSMVLSSMVISSCHLIDAITPDDAAHSVGIISFENEQGNCVPHNTFVIDNYNGMEMAAKVGGYLAPSLSALAVLILLLEFCRLDAGCLGTKCIPGMLMVGATVCQGLTFLLFKSDIFCHNEAISTCDLGNAGYNSIQAILMYAGCLVLYTFGPNPGPFAFNTSSNTTTTSSKGTSTSKSSSKSKNKKSKKKKIGPGKGEDYTKEMYEQRRKEKKVKSRGVSGRSKEEIFHERSKSSSSRDEKYETSIELYDPKKDSKRRSRSQQKYDDYVDAEPDGMDWSAFTPNQRDEYYERQRSKKRERRKKESEREKLRAWAREVDERRNRSRSPRSYGDEYSRGYDESYGDSYYDESYRHDDKYHHSDSRGNYDEEQIIADGDGDYSDYGSRSGRDSRYSRSQDDRDSRYSRSYDDRDSRYSRNRDDYSYAQDEYSYAEDDYDDEAPGDDSYYDSRSSYSSSRRSRSGGRSRSRDRRSYNGPL